MGHKMMTAFVAAIAALMLTACAGMSASQPAPESGTAPYDANGATNIYPE